MSNEEYIKEYQQFKDELDKWLFREFDIIGGSCSSIESMKYNVAREVVDKLLKSLWKDANGEYLPKIDQEVITLSDFTGDGYYRVSFAHRVDPNKVVRTTIDGKVMELHPQRYDSGGWNIPNVKYWLDYDINELLCREK